jgi:glycosyltransferase involved in cell wall biosynthesis
LRILFVFYVPSGGVETLNRQRYEALKVRGVESHFLYLKEGTGLQNQIDAPIFITNKDENIAKIIADGHYTAIVVCSDINLLEKIRLYGYEGIVLYEVQGLGKNIEHAELFLINRAYSYVMKYASGILYPKTPHLLSSIQKSFPYKKKFSFHNPINTEIFKHYDLPKSEAPIIGWVGRLEENKNWKDFLRIGERFIQIYPNLKLWMFEDRTLAKPEEVGQFQLMVNELQIQDHLVTFENQPHHKMAEYFSKIGDSGGFICSTSVVEGFGYAVLEALSCRCPVLATDSDGVRSFITHNVTGKFYQHGNINDAQMQGVSLISNTDLRERIRTNGVEHVLKHFSLSEYADNFIEMLNEFIQG